MKNAFRAIVFFVAFTPTTSLASEVTIGRWCDVLIPGGTLTQLIEFIITTDGSITFRRTFSDGSGGTSDLEELGNETYAEVDASFGEKYRIVAASGDLQLLDDDGLIRTARRLENSPRAGEC